MKPVPVLFLGSDQSYSISIKSALINARYPLVNQAEKARLIVVASYGRKIPYKMLQSVEFGGLNIHPSLLPKYRGAAPVPWTILSNETKTGVTIFKMNKAWDQGPVLAQQTTLIKPNETSAELLDRLFFLGAKLLIKILPDYIEHKITPKLQPIKSPTPYARRFTKQDGFIPWPEFIKASETSFSSLNLKLRAFYPWPGVHTLLPQKNKNSASKILKLLPRGQVQLEGKQPISWPAFKNGYHSLFNHL